MIQTVKTPTQAARPPTVTNDGLASRRVPVRSTPGPQPDAVELSVAGQREIDPSEGGAIRVELVNRVRQEIADGTYLTDDKLNTALDRLIDRTLRG